MLLRRRHSSAAVMPGTDLSERDPEFPPGAQVTLEWPGDSVRSVWRQRYIVVMVDAGWYDLMPIDVMEIIK